MRKWFASLTVLGLTAAVASAQTVPVPPIGGCNQSQSLFFDSGASASVTSWKVFNPTAANDAFNVDFDQMAGNMDITGIAMNTYQTTSTGTIGLGWGAILADNTALDPLGHTPDASNVLTMFGSFNGTVTVTGTPNVSAGFCSGFVGYSVPTATANPAVGYHAAMNFLTGDSGLWLCSDNAAPDNRSYFSLDRYASTAIKLSGYDLHMRIIGTVNTGTGSAYMTVNNSANATSLSQTAQITTTLWSNAAVQPTLYIQGIEFGYGFIQVPAITPLYTGYENLSPIADQFQGTLCQALSDPSTGPCVPAGFTCDFYGFYLDNNDLKPKNGHPKLKITNKVGITVTPDLGACNPCVCFGQSDDGNLDGTIWKVQNPAGTRDYFNVNVGNNVDPNSGGNCVSSLSQVEIASWDFCGSGPSWGSIGVYPGNTVSPAGVPDIANPIATSATLNMAPNAADFSYPGTAYPFASPVNVSTSVALATSTDVHVAAKWASGDTCSWMASDTDGIDDDTTSVGTCSKIPNTTSYFTSTGYSGGSSVAFPSASWMQRTN